MKCPVLIIESTYLDFFNILSFFLKYLYNHLQRGTEKMGNDRSGMKILADYILYMYLFDVFICLMGL